MQLLQLQQQSMALAVLNFRPTGPGLSGPGSGGGGFGGVGGGGLGSSGVGGRSGLGAAVAGAGPRLAVDAAALLARADALAAAGMGMSAHQRGLVQFLLRRNDPFLTQQFGAAVARAERGEPARLQELIGLAEKLAAQTPLTPHQHQPPPLQSPPPPLPPLLQLGRLPPPLGTTPPRPGSFPPAAAAAAATTVPFPETPRGTVAEADAAAFAAAEAAVGGGHWPGSGSQPAAHAALLGQSARAMEGLALRRRAAAVDLRDAGAFDQALTALRELKRAEALLATCRAQLDRAARLSV
jgi:hypothetical protein